MKSDERDRCDEPDAVMWSSVRQRSTAFVRYYLGAPCNSLARSSQSSIAE